MKKYFVKSYGCQMNVYDSERMGAALAARGFAETSEAEGADVVVLNTCHIREKAAEKIYSELGRLRFLKQKNKNMVVGVAGCVAQAEGEEMLRRAPVVDLLFGPQHIQDLPKLLDEFFVTGEKQLRLTFPAEEKFASLHKQRKQVGARRASAFLTIQEGCDKFCSFCVVPYTRGEEVSRAKSEILDEARALEDAGVKEITLLGQNVNAWENRATKARLADLLYELAELKRVERLRFTTSHPRDMDEELIAAFGTNKKLMPYLHLPVQSGSDRILAAMNRGHDSEFYLDILKRVRSVRPDIALSSDFIVGFPGESDEDFADTLALVDKVGFAQAFSFKYSPRAGTPAAEAEQIPEAVKDERLQILQTRLRAHAQSFQQAQVGKVLPVLFDKEQLSGRSPYLQPVHIENSPKKALYGTIADVKIVKAGVHSLIGTIAD